LARRLVRSFRKPLVHPLQDRRGGALLLLAVSGLRPGGTESMIRSLDSLDRLVLRARHLEGGLLFRREDAAIGGAAS
jgi:hypothetical protein